VCEEFEKGLCVKGDDPRLLNCSKAMAAKTGGSGCPNCTAPLYYKLEDVKPFVAHVDQFVYGGYAATEYSYLPQRMAVSCAPDLTDPNSCGAVNSWQTINCTVLGCGASPIWSTVIPKEKLVFGVGWFNFQRSLLGPTGPKDKLYGGSPSTWCANKYQSPSSLAVTNQLVTECVIYSLFISMLTGINACAAPRSRLPRTLSIQRALDAWTAPARGYSTARTAVT
jgi:hypothetical protein